MSGSYNDAIALDDVGVNDDFGGLGWEFASRRTGDRNSRRNAIAPSTIACDTIAFRFLDSEYD